MKFDKDIHGILRIKWDDFGYSLTFSGHEVDIYGFKWNIQASGLIFMDSSAYWMSSFPSRWITQLGKPMILI